MQMMDIRCEASATKSLARVEVLVADSESQRLAMKKFSSLTGF
jgi:hypothetical protein